MSTVTNEHDVEHEQATADVTRVEFDQMRGEFQRLLDQKPTRLVVEDDGEFATCLDTAKFEQIQRLATLYSKGSIVPEQFQGSMSNCYIGIQMALRCGIDPLMFLQKCYIVHGRPGIEATLAIALANKSGVFKHRLSYELSGSGDSRKCVCSGVIKDTGEVVEETMTVTIAKDMGWWNKKGSLWPNMTDLLLRYRSAMWLIRTTCPEVIMGMQSTDELKDVEGSAGGGRASKKTERSSLNDELEGDTGPIEPEAEPEKQPTAFDWGVANEELRATTTNTDAARVYHKYAETVPDEKQWVEMAADHKNHIRDIEQQVNV